MIIWEKTMPSPEKYWALFFGSIFWIGVLTYIMVDATMRIGCILHINELVMGLIFLAAGTSVPDALGSIAVAKQGEGDMAVANALGSNVFDIMLGLGIPWMIRTIGYGEVVKMNAKELPKYMIILCIVLVFFVGALVINRWKL